MHKTLYYLSGKITDTTREKELLNMQRFFDVEADLLKRGFAVFNPARLEVEDAPWEYYLARDLKYILEHKPLIYLISRDWVTSRGAMLEVEMARLLNLPIIGPL